MRSSAAILFARLRWALVALFVAATAYGTDAGAQEPRPIPALMFDLRAGFGLERETNSGDGAAGIGFLGVAIRVDRRIAVDINLSGIEPAFAVDKANVTSNCCASTSLSHFTSRGATAGFLVGLGPARQPERTTFALGAGVFLVGDADVPLGSRSKVLGFNAGIDQAFEFMSHYGVTIGLHPQVLVNLRGGIWVIAPVSIGLRFFQD